MTSRLFTEHPPLPVAEIIAGAPCRVACQSPDSAKAMAARLRRAAPGALRIFREGKVLTVTPVRNFATAVAKIGEELT